MSDIKVFSSDEFINKLKWLVNDVPNIYASGSGLWCTYHDKKWRMDCVCSIKGILWGFSADKKKKHGGAIYKSNGVADFTCNGALKYCTEISQDFNKLVPGEYLCMKDTKYNHSGIYLGNGKVFECTTGWNVNRCVISDISNKGVRSYKGKKNLKWTYHGKLNYIDYSKNDIVYQVYDNKKKKWLPSVTNLNDYAGIFGNPIGGIRAKSNNNTITIISHICNGKWLPAIKKWDNSSNGYSGIYGKNIDGFAIKSSSGIIKYRAHVLGGNWLPWVQKYDINDYKYGMAGVYGKPIDAIQMCYV